MLIVACIKWGSKYPADYVNRLYRAVERNMTVPHEFVCYTDDAQGLECVAEPLPHGHSGWWNKLYLFSLDKDVLLIDLDCVIVGNMDALVTDSFTTIKDPWQAGYNSSVVRIAPGMTDVWDKYLVERPQHKLHGDQDWLNLHPGFKSESCYPSHLCKSYKVEIKGRPVPEGTCLVYFHGEPKPHQVNDQFVKECWI